MNYNNMTRTLCTHNTPKSIEILIEASRVLTLLTYPSYPKSFTMFKRAFLNNFITLTNQRHFHTSNSIYRNNLHSFKNYTIHISQYSTVHDLIHTHLSFCL